jgi:hypothetical protein
VYSYVRSDHHIADDPRRSRHRGDQRLERTDNLERLTLATERNVRRAKGVSAKHTETPNNELLSE